MKVQQPIRWFMIVTRWDVLAALSTLLIALSVNALFLLIPPPVLISRSLFNFRLDVATLLVIFLGLIFSRKGIIWSTIGLTLTLVLFSIPLIYKWQTTGFYGYLIGGLLPWSDAAGYYSGAQHLLYEGHLTTWATRRPLFGGFLAVLLSITDNNLQVSLAILAMLNGLAVYFAAREIEKKHGSWIAATFLLICYWYYCSHAGVTASEQLGLCLGALGLAVLIRGIQDESIKKAVFGLFVLTVGLNARAGAFFILPVLIVWLGIVYQQQKLGWRRAIALGVGAVILGMLGNLFIAKTIGAPDAAPFSNYSYTLYGLASGNAGWSQVIRDHPDVKEEDVAWLALEKIRENPSLFIIGILRSYRDFFTTSYGPFSFLGIVNDRGNLGNLLLMGLAFVALVVALQRRGQRQYSLILAAFLGILLSVGLVPPRDANFMRIYAATIPFTAYIASMGLSILQYPLKRIGPNPEVPSDWNNQYLLLPFSIILLIVSFIAPLFIKMSSQPIKNSSSVVSCLPGEKQIAFLLGKGSSVQLVEDSSVRESYLPLIRITDFRSRTASGPYSYPALMETLLGLNVGQAISIGWSQQNTGLIGSGYLVTNQTLEWGSHQICATPAQDGELSGFFFDTAPQEGTVVSHNLSVFHQNPALVARARNFYGLSVVLIFVFAMASYFEVMSTSPAKRFFLLEGTLLIFAGILVYLHVHALFFHGWERNPVNTKTATHRGGYSYEVSLGVDWMNRKELGESPAVIYEDGIPLKFPNTPPFSVDRRGKGRFTIEGGNLILSSSDNSDPRSNGRHYEIYWPTPISSLLRTICYTLTIVFLLLMYSHRINQIRNYR